MMKSEVSSEEKWPNFFIVGTAKAGTTSLHNHLAVVPAVFMSKVKEPNFFSSPCYPDNSRIRVIRDKRKYLELFKGVKHEKAIGESSTSYLYSPEAPRLIKQVIPEARIFIILRDPVQRAFSHYLMNLSNGYQKLPFYEALQKDYYCDNKSLGVTFLYVELGLYAEQVKRYFNIFGRKKVKVLFFEEFVKNTTAGVKETLKFLDIDCEPPKHIDYENKFFLPNNVILKMIFTRKTTYKLLGLVPNTPLTKPIRKRILANSVKKPDLPEDAKRFLENIYKDDIVKLESLLERPLPWLSTIPH